MSIPKNPNTVIIKNKYYPSGLNQQMIWEHYQMYKNSILKETVGRDLLIFLFVDLNEYVIKRTMFNAPIKLNKNNYDTIINGRTVGLSIEHLDKSNYCCIDIDPGNSVNEYQLKECVNDILTSNASDISIVTHNRVISTSKSYHVYFYLKKYIRTEVIKNTFIRSLNMSLGNKYLINKKSPKGNEINLDFYPMTYKGSHVVPYSINRNGLMAMDITKNWESYNRRNSIVK